MNDQELLVKLYEQLQQSNELLRESKKIIDEKNLALKSKDEIIEKQKNELQTWDIIKKPESQVDIKNAADILKLPYKGKRTLGQNLLFEFLRDCNILSSHTTNWNEPYHQYIPVYFNITEARIEHLEKTFPKTIVTQEGLDFIRQLYEERGDEWILSR